MAASGPLMSPKHVGWVRIIHAVVTNWHDTNAMLGLGYMFCIVNWEAMRSFDHGETSKFITTGCSQNTAGLNCYI